MISNRRLMLGLFLFLLVLLMISTLVSTQKQSALPLASLPTPSPTATLAPIPSSTTALPKGTIDPGDENTFNTTVGYIFNADPNGTGTSWKDATHIQAQGKLIKWTDKTLVLGVQAGRLTLYIPDRLRYLCRPITIPGLEGQPPKPTKDVYAPINQPEKLGVLLDRAQLPKLLPPNQTIYVVAQRNQDRLEAILVAGYGCGYPQNSNEVNP